MDQDRRTMLRRLAAIFVGGFLVRGELPDAQAQEVARNQSLQELLQGFHGPSAQDRIVERFSALPLLVPNREDHVHAAELRNSCRRRGVQVGTIDALLAQLCIRHELTMLATDADFERIARLHPLDVWRDR